MNPGRSLFLLYALKSSPRLGLLYLYLFDYTDTFLPFIHTICPLQEGGSSEDIITRLLVGLQRALGRVLLPSLGSGGSWRCSRSLSGKSQQQEPSFQLFWEKPHKRKASRNPSTPEGPFCLLRCIAREITLRT